MIKCLETTDQIKTHLLNKKNRYNNTASILHWIHFFHNKKNNVPSDIEKLLDPPYTAQFVLDLHVKRGEFNVRSGIT